jgi:hypothetical protein
MATFDKACPVCQMTSEPPEPHEKGGFLMVTYATIRGQILARVPGIDLADIPGLLQLLICAARGSEERDRAQVTHALAGLEALWVEEIAYLREAIAAQQHDGLSRGLTEPAAVAEIGASLRREFLAGEIPTLSR